MMKALQYTTWALDEWPRGLSGRHPAALAEAGRAFRDEVDYHRWVQFQFHRQWTTLRRHARQRGVGLIGDLPILVVRVVGENDRSLVRQVLRAQEYWRLKGLSAEVLILNEHPASYLDEIHEQLQAGLETGPWAAWKHRPGGVYLLRRDLLAEPERVLLMAAARAVLSGERGALAEKYDDPTSAARTFALATTQTQMRLRHLGISTGDDADFTARLEQAARAQADVLITTGVAAQGDADVVRRHGEAEFLPTDLRPGRGLLVGTVARFGHAMTLLGLPGNAVAAYAGSRLEAHGIMSSEVSAFAAGAGTGKRFTLLVGSFDLDGLREELDDRHYDKEEYRGVEVWEREAGWASDLESRVALMDTLIILGNEAGVESCIKVIKAGDASWLSKADMNDVASRLPGGLYAELATQWTGLLANGFEAYGISAKKQDSDTLKIAGAVKFNDEDDADDAEDAIEDVMDQRFDSVEVPQE